MTNARTLAFKLI